LYINKNKVQPRGENSSCAHGRQCGTVCRLLCVTWARSDARENLSFQTAINTVRRLLYWRRVQCLDLLTYLLTYLVLKLESTRRMQTAAILTTDEWRHLVIECEIQCSILRRWRRREKLVDADLDRRFQYL